MIAAQGGAPPREKAKAPNTSLNGALSDFSEAQRQANSTLAQHSARNQACALAPTLDGGERPGFDGIQRRAAERDAAIVTALERQRRQARPEDYVFDKAQEAFWDLKDCTLHTEKGVDASIPQELWRVVVDERPRAAARERIVKPSLDIMRVENDQFVEGSTWWPGRPQLIRDLFIDSSGARPAEGRRIYNQYIPPPTIEGGNAARAKRWVEHVKKLWPDPVEHESFFDYCAHMLQRPEEKCNTAIVLSGTQGIGKDAALLPVREALGAWNVKSIDPDELFAPFKPWLQTLMLVINEVRPTKDEFHASSMYNILKPLAAAPPDTLSVNDKNVKLRYVVNVMRVFLTTNNYLSMFIPPEDRRMCVLHSTLPKEWHIAEGKKSYFVDLFRYFEREGGVADVSAWLRGRVLSAFDPKAPPPKTAAWGAVVASGEPPEAGELIDIIEKMGNPDALTLESVVQAARNDRFNDLADELANIRNRRVLPHRFERAGYVSVRNPEATNGLFKIGGRRRAVYARKEFSLGEQVTAARRLKAEHGVGQGAAGSER